MSHTFQFGLFDRPPEDICERKHGGNSHSSAANARVEPHKASMRERVRVYVAGCGWHGATLHELCEKMEKLPHQISGRITELKRAGRVFDSGRERGGAAVLVSERYLCGKN